jgi:hypothetical protein
MKLDAHAELQLEMVVGAVLVALVLKVMMRRKGR